MIFLYNILMNAKYAASKKVFEKHNGLLRLSEAVRLGVPEHIVYQMVQKGDLVREARGLYHLTDGDPLANPDLVQVSLLVPKGVVCLISALYFYELTTQIPHSVYIALPQNACKPRMTYPPLEVFWVTASLHAMGVDVYVLDGIKVKIYKREKTVADCFKFRKRIGEEIALEALKDYVNHPKADVQKLLQYAKINRVEKLMIPYLKGLL